MNSLSQKVAWINENIKPFEVGVEPKDESFVYEELDTAFNSLPLNLNPFLRYVRNDGNLFVGGRTIDRLVIAVLNEDDNRIANFRTKHQVLELFQLFVSWSRLGRLRMRRVFQVTKRWNEDIEPVKGIVTDWDDSLQEKLITLFFSCWRITKDAETFIRQNYTRSNDIIFHILREYGAIAVQSTVRGFLGRIYHRRELQKAKDENRKEIQKWSILILQKVARGYIARKTIVRSMKIRKQLSRDVLRIAEKFMKSGDVWGFLGDINEELERSKKELKDTEAREDNWASKFVEKVVTHRQAEFNDAWDRFPAALQNAQKSNVAIGSLIDDHKDLSKPSKHDDRGSAADHSVVPLADTSKGGATQPLASSSSSLKTTINPKSKSAKKGTISEEEVVAAMNFTTDTHYSNNPDRMPGPLLRKALQTTVKVEVASQLNKIMQTSFHSKKLAQDIVAVYGPDSIVKKGKKVRSAAVAGPVKKKKTTLDGKVAKQVGKVSANASDWLSSQATQRQDGHHSHSEDEDEDEDVHGHSHASSSSRMAEVQPGNTLLLDVPLGLGDSIERLMHAAALRCYVPDFFRGATESLAKQQEEQWKAAQKRQRRKRRFEKEKKRLLNAGCIEEANQLQLGDASLDSDTDEKGEEGDEDDYDGLGESPTDADLERQYHSKQKTRRKFLEDFPQSKNLDPNYAYRVYLSLPLGLAKIRYENECKKWAQPYINQLRIKGLHSLSDVLPVSKFTTCMVNVQTPRILRNKTIDLCLDLKHMGSAVWGNHTAPSIAPQSLMNSSNHTTGTSSGKRSRSSSPTRSSVLLIEDGVQQTHSPHNHTRVRFEDTQSISSGTGTFRADLDNMENIDGTMRQLSERNAILAKQSAELAREVAAQSQAKELLQSILENPDADWCKLTAPIDDFFIQAAFLVVPHIHHHPKTEEIPFSDRNSHIIMTVEDMGNAAFKAYAMELCTLEDEKDREDFVRARFRSAVILTTPFTLYMKNRGILTVEDLLRVNLQDMQLPPALLYQLEVLITIVVGRQVHAKILPTSTKAHSEDIAKQQKQKTLVKTTFASSGAGADFAVPLFYDTRFQRTALDPFGRPPVFTANQQGKTSASTVATKKKLKQIEAKKKKLSTSLTQFEKVTSMAALEEDLNQPPDIFTLAGDHQYTHNDSSQLNMGGNSVAWDSSQQVSLSNPADGTSALQSPQHMQQTQPLAPVRAPHTAIGTYKGHQNVVHHSASTSQLSLPGYVINVEEDGSSVGSSMAGVGSPGQSVDFAHNSSVALLNSSKRLWHAPVAEEHTHTRQKDISGKHESPKKERPLQLPEISRTSNSAGNMTDTPTKKAAVGREKESKDFIAINRAVRPVDAFKETYRCHYPGCNQVFSRNYTYKVHLKTHEIFPQYHEYKNNPQLFLDTIV